MRVLYVTGLIVVVDQVSKLLVKGFDLPLIGYWKGMELNKTISLVGDFFRLNFVENPGMAFGIDIGGKIFLTVFSTLASMGIVYYLYKIRDEALVIRVSLALILGGAIGNLIDRMFYGVIFGEAPFLYGKVVDFFDVDFFDVDFAGVHISRWPVFNVADAAVTIGVILLLVFHRKFTAVEDQRMVFVSSPVTDSNPRPIEESGSSLKKEVSPNTEP